MPKNTLNNIRIHCWTVAVVLQAWVGRDSAEDQAAPRQVNLPQCVCPLVFYFTHHSSCHCLCCSDFWEILDLTKKKAPHTFLHSFFSPRKPVVQTQTQTQTATIYLWAACDQRKQSRNDLSAPAGLRFLSLSGWRWWCLRGESEWWKTHIFSLTLLGAVSLETTTGFLC